MKDVRSSQLCISINFCTEFSKAQVFPVSIVKLKIKFKTIIKNPSYPYLKFLDMVCYEHNINLMTLVMNRITFYGPPDRFIQTLRCYYFSNI